MVSYESLQLFLLFSLWSNCSKIIYKNIHEQQVIFDQNIFNRAWIISLILLAFINLVDMTYFDGRISIGGWILLAEQGT